MTERAGSCLCGQVTYRITGEPLTARICWCRDCQRMSSNGTVNAIFPNAAVAITGSTSTYSSAADSGHRIDRHFCARCGSHLFADNSGRPGFMVVRVGTLHDPSSIKLAANIWTGSAPNWACLDPELDNVPRQPAAPRPPTAA